MLHITVIANEKKRKKKIQGGGEDMQRQGTLGASGGRKRNEGDARGWMDMWKDGIKNRSGGKSEMNTSLKHRVHDVFCLALFLLGSAVCVTLFPFGRGKKSRALAKTLD